MICHLHVIICRRASNLKVVCLCQSRQGRLELHNRNAPSKTGPIAFAEDK